MALERTDGKNSKLFSFSNRVKPAWLQGSGWTKRTVSRRISSRARYDRFDTSPFNDYSIFGANNMISSAAPSTSRTTLRVYFNPIFTAKNHSKKFLGEKQERKQKTIRFLILKTLLYQGFPADETTQAALKFRVRPERPLRYAFVYSVSFMQKNNAL